MLMEGLVGIVALIAAASLDPKLYYDINVDLSQVASYQTQLDELYDRWAAHEEHAIRCTPRKSMPRPSRPGQRGAMVGGESLRGRTGGAVTLAVGMAFIFTDALRLDRVCSTRSA